MSIERLQAAIRERKTPVALGLAPEIEKVSPKIVKNFEEMFGPGMMANAEALRFHACQTMDAAQGKLPAVVISAEHYLRYGMMGADVLSNLTGAASARGLYAIVDCRTTRPELWLGGPMAGDGLTVMPYVGGDCVPQDTDKAIFAVVRTANGSSSEVQNLIAGDRPLYAAMAQQMARKGAALGWRPDTVWTSRRCAGVPVTPSCCCRAVTDRTPSPPLTIWATALWWWTTPCNTAAMWMPPSRK